jgi:hypothetical protein
MEASFVASTHFRGPLIPFLPAYSLKDIKCSAMTQMSDLLLGHETQAFGYSKANFHEKAHFVKADVAAPVLERNGFVSFALCFHPHS